MIKINIVIFILILTHSLNADEPQSECPAIFKRYDIYPEIKSVRGWKRVTNQNKLHLYFDYPKNQEYKISKCLIKNGFNILKHNREIGGIQ